ncbi:MAG: DNA polymerase IV, partial [Planctomycetota bacterium]|nr:DNA polymerase IV [Planctomycetota bacterium]
PEATVLPPDFTRYEAASAQVMGILETASPVVEPLSIDEAFLDVTGSRRLLGDGPTIGGKLRARIREQVGLTASVGVAASKFVAKLASDLDKPDGLVVIDPRDQVARLAPLPISRMWGIGPVAAARCEARGLRTFADLQRAEDVVLRSVLGEGGPRFRALAHGVDERPVVGDRIAKSIGHEQTFGVDLADPLEVESVLLRHVERVATRLRRQGRRGRGITVKIRDGDFVTNTRSRTLSESTDRTDLLWESAREAFRGWEFRPVRLIGFAVDRFGEEGASLFAEVAEDDQRRRRLDAATDRIRQKFGGDSIGRTSAAFPPEAARSRSEGAERRTEDSEPEV